MAKTANKREPNSEYSKKTSKKFKSKNKNKSHKLKKFTGVQQLLNKDEASSLNAAESSNTDEELKGVDEINIEKDLKEFVKQEQNEEDLKEPVIKKEPKEEDLKDFVKKEQKKNAKRYVLFVGNLLYSSTTQDIENHFVKKGCDVVHVRLPKEKNTNKPRGFGYVDLRDEASFLKALSLHHSFLDGRRINVLYTIGGKKKGDKAKQIIQHKNLKLQALRKAGKLVPKNKMEFQKQKFGSRKKGNKK